MIVVVWLKPVATVVEIPIRLINLWMLRRQKWCMVSFVMHIDKFCHVAVNAHLKVAL